jgi:hypothetical protein
MSENGDGNGVHLDMVAHSDLIDELVLTFDRATGMLKIGGRTINLEVALDICQRGVRFFDTQLRIQAAAAMQQQQADQVRVNDLLNRARQRSS